MTFPRVLVVADYYLPGFRAGGPIRAIANSITRLSGQVVFSVITRDHDCDGARYRDIQSESWNSGPAGLVRYVPRFTCRVLERSVRESDADVIWLNSIFSSASLRVLFLRRLGRIRPPVLLAPRGEFSPEALGLSRRRKRAALAVLRHFGFLRGVHWIASSALEARATGNAVPVTSMTIVPESVGEPSVPDGWLQKRPCALRMAFASRIDAMKNLRFLLDVLTQSRGPIHLDVIGPIDDPAYWESCRLLIQRMPPGVIVEYVGELPHAALGRRLREYDVMVLPTLGENFGHIVVEAWAAGCPVLVSDRTPWRLLAEDGVGWDLPLDHESWIQALERCRAMDAREHMAMRQRAVERARRVWHDGVSGEEIFKRLIVKLALGGESTTWSANQPCDDFATRNPDLCR